MIWLQLLYVLFEERYIGLWWRVYDVILDTSRRGGPLWLDFLAGVYRILFAISVRTLRTTYVRYVVRYGTDGT